MTNDFPHATWREVYDAMGVDPDGHEELNHERED
jgi:NADH:ubiquinone oxidoreductase subunit C